MEFCYSNVLTMFNALPFFSATGVTLNGVGSVILSLLVDKDNLDFGLMQGEITIKVNLAL